ncbi:MAG: TRAP transporter small permease [Bacillota bacterium]
MKKLIFKINDAIYKVELFIGVSILVSIVFIVFLQVFNRFVLKQPLSWSEELARYLFIILVFIGISVATKAKAHFGIDFIIQKLGPRARNLVGTVIALGILYFLWVVFSKSFLLINSAMTQKSPAMGITMGYLYYTFPFFAAFAMVHIFTNLVEDLFGGDKG